MIRLVKVGQTTRTNLVSLFENKIFGASFLLVWILAISFLPNLADFRLGVTHFLGFTTFLAAGFIASKAFHRFEGRSLHFVKSLFAYFIVAPIFLTPFLLAGALLANTPDVAASVSTSLTVGLVFYAILGLPFMLIFRSNQKPSKS